MNIKRDLSISTIGSFALSAILITNILFILLQNIPTPSYNTAQSILDLNAQEGVANAVTTVVVYFRGFDTLGEIAVLFLAALGIGLMLQTKNMLQTTKTPTNFMLQEGSKLLFPFIFIFGIYVITYGHLSPGGGFQGGVIIASGILLLFISNKSFTISHKLISLLEMLAGISYVVIALIGLLILDHFLGNFLPHPISEMGLLVSGGIIPIIYFIVGVKVGSEMSVIVENLLKRETNV